MAKPATKKTTKAKKATAAKAKAPAAKKAPAKKAAAKPAKNDSHFKVGLTSAEFKASIERHLHESFARDTTTATKQDWWNATSYAIRDLILQRFMKTQKHHHDNDVRRMYYFSIEYLMGRLLSNNLHNVGMFEVAAEALKEIGVDIEEVLDEEEDMALGNGGLGRLAACFIDSLATLEYPAIGYGIHYEFGLFKQDFRNGRQIELADVWEQYGSPWQIQRPEYHQEIKLYGHVEDRVDENGRQHKVWVHSRVIKGVPWDIPIVGYGAKTVNILRLWESNASEEFDLDVFNAGGYVDSVRDKAEAETISKVLYPNDETDAGKELRLVQQYFFSACSLKDIIRRFKSDNSDWKLFPEKVAVQLNDTHPAVSIPELMRILVDEEAMSWESAWTICRKVFAYTNHTLLPEALEKWTVALFEKVLPRHLEIIFEINRRFLEEEVEAQWPGDDAMKKHLSIIEDGGQDGNKMIRMGHLSVVGSHTVNGVAALHSALVKSDLFPEFNELYPGKLTNVTNGITPRRWLKACNPRLSALIDEKIGDDWPFDLKRLEKLADFAEDAKFQKDFMEAKYQNKVELAEIIQRECGVEVSPDAIFDIQIKRLHEYKRQQLNLLHIMGLYKRLLDNPDYDMPARVFIFGAKAAPGYYLAKEIIYAINKVADRVNNDPRIQGKLKVVFLPNYRVSLAEKIIPAADVSEQISTAGKEASGTGNMKLALNGALTVGTLDGANVEIAEEVGDDNIFIFGLKVDEVKALKASGYNPYDYYHNNEELKTVIDWLYSDFFTPGQHGALAPVANSLLEGGDAYLALADYEAYSEAQWKLGEAYRDTKGWAKSAILNTALMGKFSSDRSMEDYSSNIWALKKEPVA